MSVVVPPRAREGAAQLRGAEVDRLIRAALAEDLGGSSAEGDVTTESLIEAGARARAKLVAKGSGRVAGLDVFVRVFELLDPEVRARRHFADGARVQPGDELVELEGAARALLTGERTALNFVQHLSGVATLTARFVEAVRGRARILDTRKTTPLLRALEKHAVRCGGGENHRFGLFDEAMVKNNHVDLCTGGLRELVETLRAREGEELRITAEARDESEALEAIAGGADVVLLDNFAPADLALVVPRLRSAAGARAVELEASGGITLANVESFAATGVDRISIGALTHSASALDLSLVLERAR